MGTFGVFPRKLGIALVLLLLLLPPGLRSYLTRFCLGDGGAVDFRIADIVWFCINLGGRGGLPPLDALFLGLVLVVETKGATPQLFPEFPAPTFPFLCDWKLLRWRLENSVSSASISCWYFSPRACANFLSVPARFIVKASMRPLITRSHILASVSWAVNWASLSFSRNFIVSIDFKSHSCWYNLSNPLDTLYSYFFSDAKGQHGIFERGPKLSLAYQSCKDSHTQQHFHGESSRFDRSMEILSELESELHNPYPNHILNTYIFLPMKITKTFVSVQSSRRWSYDSYYI